MRKKFSRLKYATLAALAGAFLLASCSQTQTQVPEENPPANEPPKPIQISIEGIAPGDVIGGITTFQVGINEDSQVTEVSAYIDDVLIGSYQINVSDVAPQALNYTFNLNTYACSESYLGALTGLGCSPSDTTPVILNGEHTIKVVAKNSEETRDVSVNIAVFNRDWMLTSISGNSAKDSNEDVWYGGGDVSITAYPILYSGADVSAIRFKPPSSLDVGAGSGTSVDVPVSDGSATLTIAAADNSTYEGSTSFSLYFVYGDGSVSSSYWASYRLDFAAPGAANSAVVCREDTPLAANDFATSSNLYAGVDAYAESGVGGVKAIADVQTTAGATVLADYELMGLELTSCGAVAKLEGLPEGGFYTVTVKKLVDALGNGADYALNSVVFAIDNTPPELTLATGADSRVYFNSASLNTGSLVGFDLNGNSVGPNLSSNAYAAASDPAGGNPPVSSGVASYAWSVNGEPITGLTTEAIPGLNDIGAVLGTAPQGYYELSVQAVDVAGNKSAPLSLTVLYDNTAPNVVFTSPTVTSLTGASTFTATASATDNVALKSGAIYWQVAGYTFEALAPVTNAWGSTQTAQDYSTALTAWLANNGGNPSNLSLYAEVYDQAGNSLATATLGPLSVTPANANGVGSVASVTDSPNITAAGGGSTTLTIDHTAGTANLVAMHIYRYDPDTGYYEYLGDASDVGGGTYTFVVTLPAGVAGGISGDALFLIVEEYDNGLIQGNTYNYDTDALTAAVF